MRLLQSIRRCVIAFMLVVSVAFVLYPLPTWGLTEYERGNRPVEWDPGWPAGSMDLADLSTRVGFSQATNTWTPGFNFDGGATEFVYRGNTAAFQDALDHFAKIRTPERMVVIDDVDQGASWLRTANDGDTHVDWSFSVWSPRDWYRLDNPPTGIDKAFRGPIPPPTLHVAVSGPGMAGIDWSKIKVPAGVAVIDRRATSAGYTRDDGAVFRGDVYDFASSKPLTDAQITLDSKSVAASDARGHFEIKHLPAGTHEFTISAPAHVGERLFSGPVGQNTLLEHVFHLAGPVSVHGAVQTPEGKPVAGIHVRVERMMGLDGKHYGMTSVVQAISDGQGEFQLSGLPAGIFQVYAAGTGDLHQLENTHIFSTNDKAIVVMSNSGRSQASRPDGQP